jgi:multidrug efflux system outer membrane protein
VSQTGQARVFEQYGATLGVTSYELDLFGRIRSLNSAALETFFATEQARRATQISLVANIGVAFLTLETDRQQLALSKATLENYRAALRLVERGLQAGTATELDRRQAATLVAQTEAEVQRGVRLVETDTNALRLLVGADLPDGFDAGFMDQDMAIGSGQGLPVLAPVPAGLPADLLQRRPDILEAEHQLKAANADIGAARAAFFPKVTLTGSGGTVSQSVTGLFGAGQGAWSFAPQISLPIFSGGRLKGNLHYAQANRDIAVTTYEKAIQTAFREVADGLAARATFGSQLDAQRREVRSSQSYLDLATKAWRGGVSQYIVVLDAQRTVFSAQKQYLTDRLAQQTSEISLYRALGGGWTAGTPPLRLSPGRSAPPPPRFLLPIPHRRHRKRGGFRVFPPKSPFYGVLFYGLVGQLARCHALAAPGWPPAHRGVYGAQKV